MQHEIRRFLRATTASIGVERRDGNSNRSPESSSWRFVMTSRRFLPTDRSVWYNDDVIYWFAWSPALVRPCRGHITIIRVPKTKSLKSIDQRCVRTHVIVISRYCQRFGGGLTIIIVYRSVTATSLVVTTLLTTAPFGTCLSYSALVPPRPRAGRSCKCIAPRRPCSRSDTTPTDYPTY